MKKTLLLSLIVMMALGTKAQDSTRLYQNFNLNDSNTAGEHFPPGWYAYSVTGSQVWKWYNIYGVNNSACLQFNDYVSGGDNQDEAWVFTPKLDLSSYTASIYLNFSASYYFHGDSLHVFASTDYSGTGNPHASGVTWTELSHTGVMRYDTSYNTDVFEEYQVNLTAFKSTPIYVGFKYSSSDTDGSRWDIDSVTTGTTSFGSITGVNNVANETLPLQVIGACTPGQMKLEFDVEEGMYSLEIYDVIGRRVYNEYFSAQAGKQSRTLNNLNLTSGMYIIKLGDENAYGITRAIVQ